MSDLRVVLLTQWYPPEPAWQPLWIVEALVEAGASCQVVTGVPNYPSGEVQDGYSPWRRRRDVVEGVPVLRTPLYPDHGRGVVKRFVNYGSWALSSAALGRGPLRAADVVLVYSSPATAAAAAMLTRRLHGTPYVLLVQDLWPDSVTQSGMIGPRAQQVAESVLTPLVDAAYRGASAVVAISPGMARWIVERGVPEDKVHVVHNWVAPAAEDSSAPQPLRELLGIAADAFVLMYAGNHGVAQGLGPVVDAFAGLDQHHHLVLVGAGVEKPDLQARSAAQALTNVHFVESRPSPTVRAWMQEADAQLVSLVDQPLFRVTVPSKLQMALAEGCPVLAVAPGDVSDIVSRAGAGLTASPGDVDSIRSAVTRMGDAGREQHARWGRAAQVCYDSTMAPSVGSERLMTILRAAAHQRAAPRARGSRRGEAH